MTRAQRWHCLQSVRPSCSRSKIGSVTIISPWQFLHNPSTLASSGIHLNLQATHLWRLHFAQLASAMPYFIASKVAHVNALSCGPTGCMICTSCDMDDFTVEYASFHPNGTRVSASQKRQALQAENSLLRKVHRTLTQRSDMERLLYEIKAALPEFDEVQLVMRNKHSSCRKRLRVQGIDPEQYQMPTFEGRCERCMQAIPLSEAHIILSDTQLLSWMCVPCIPDQGRVERKASLAALRNDVDTGLLNLRRRFDDLEDPEPRDAVTELLETVQVLKASARKTPDEDPAASAQTSIKGLEKDAWSMALTTTLPDFPRDILGQCLVCSSMPKTERDGLAHLHRRLRDAHNRIYLLDLGALIKESVTRRNTLLAHRYKGTKVEPFSPDDAISQWHAQAGLCSSCGEALVWSRLIGGMENFPELDRSDVRIHTYRNNCSWMCHSCNSTKGWNFDVRVYDEVLLDTVKNVQAMQYPRQRQAMLGTLHMELDRQRSRQGFMCKKI